MMRATRTFTPILSRRTDRTNAVRRHPTVRARLGSLLSSCLGFLLLAILSVGPAPGSAAAAAAPWESLADGLSVSLWRSGGACPEDVTAVVLRIDPERFAFSIRSYRDDGLAAPIPLAEWRRRTGAALVFNAGLFFDDFSYMGLLFKNGAALSPKRHAQWQGLFVAEPVTPGPQRARIIDLAREEFSSEAPAYREAAQALMLVDRTGKLRVRQSTKRAQQTLIAEDTAGSVYVIKTMDAVSLFGIGECVRQTLPWLHQVMAMDGGSSSDAMLGTQILTHSDKPAGPPWWRSILDGTAPAIHIPLPTVIAVYPRETSPTSAPASPPAR